MPDRIAATYTALTRQGWQIFLGGWAVVGAAMIVAGFMTDPMPLWIVGPIILVVFVPLLLLARKRFANPHPVLVIGPDGYHDRRLGVAIPWGQIERLQRLNAGTRIFLQIEVQNPERYLGNAGLLKGPMLRINPGMGFPVLSSNLSGLDHGQEELAAAALAWWAAGRG